MDIPKYITDHQLMTSYWLGWYDCYDNNHRLATFLTDIEQVAYILGWDHYIMGDDQESIDALSEQEILSIIRRAVNDFK